MTPKLQASSLAVIGALAGRGGPLRYAAAGLVNSGVGYAVILGLSAWGAPALLANAGGFAAGFLVSLLISSAWTFGLPRRAAAPARYAAAFAACYALNLCVVGTGLAAGLPEAIAQGGGVAGYAVSFYLACRWWVFGDAETASRDLAAAGALAASSRVRTTLAAFPARRLRDRTELRSLTTLDRKADERRGRS